MIVVFVGGMGSGKTLSMVKQAYAYYKDGYTILSNMKLFFPHKLISSNDIVNFAKSKKGLYNTVVLIDEMHIFLDSRRSASKKNILGTYFITQTRKQQVKLLATTQHRHQLDRRVRDNVSIYVDCEKHELPIKDDKDRPLLLIVNHFNTRTMYSKFTFLGNKYFSLYDTEEIIFDDDI